MYDKVEIKRLNNDCLILFLKDGWRYTILKVVYATFDELKNLIHEKDLKMQEKYEYKSYTLFFTNHKNFEKFFNRKNIFDKIPPGGGGLNGFFKYLEKINKD